MTPPRNHDDSDDYDERYEDDYDNWSADTDGERRIVDRCPFCGGKGVATVDVFDLCQMCNGTGEW
jgi:RecJ-like exonuclease